jgi:hypothetical protein
MHVEYVAKVDSALPYYLMQSEVAFSNGIVAIYVLALSKCLNLK